MMVIANKLGNSLSGLLTSIKVPVFAVRKDYLLNQVRGQEKRRQ
jgi:hypothetical protein